MSNLAPVALFVYNRIEHVRKTLNSLSNNLYAEKSDLYIFSDGAKTSEDISLVNGVRKYCSSINNFKSTNINYKFKTFGILSAIFLVIHSIFLGIKFDIQIYKLMRRVVILLFIIFEIIAQGILVYHFFKIKDKLSNMINKNVLILKAFLVTILASVAILSLPILIDKGNTHFKHALEWNYFIGVIFFYLFTRFLWKRTT